MRAGVVHGCEPAARDDRDRGEDEHHRRDEERADCGELDLPRLDLLAEVLRRASDHQPRDEDRDDDVEEHPVEAGSDAAPDDLAGEHVRDRHGAARAVSASWPPFTEPLDAFVVVTAQLTVDAIPSRTSLSDMFPPLEPSPAVMFTPESRRTWDPCCSAGSATAIPMTVIAIIAA